MSTAQATSTTAEGYRGTERLLWGLVLAVLTFWLFAGTAGTIAPAIRESLNAGGTQVVDAAAMNLAVSVTALFSGMFIVLVGGLADRYGRVLVTRVGLVLGVLGSVLLISASGAAALPLLIVGRAIQGLSAACIMPASMALVKTYWDGPARQRAVSMWSIGSWGGSGLAALFGGGVVSYVGWRGIFIASILVSCVSFIMLLGTPESKVTVTRKAPFDVVGLILFITGTLSLMVVLLFGARLGWASPTSLGLLALAAVAWSVCVVWERRRDNPFIDFRLFRNTTFTGATISNFLINGTIGLLMVSSSSSSWPGTRPTGRPSPPGTRAC